MSERLAVSLVLPAHDEAANIGEAIEGARRVLARATEVYEIIVVDDGSRDETAAIAASFPEVRVVRHDRNRGYGAALRSGFRAARKPWVALMDADLQFDPEDLARLFDASEGVDIVAGYRAPRRDPPARRLLGAAWTALIRVLFRLPVRDVDCALKLFRKALLDALPLASDGAFINAEILVRARAHEARVRQIPVRHLPRLSGRSSGANLRVIARAVRELIELRRGLQG
jgi:glycosyltransferase involved in cell wall biosynthesis